MGQVYAWAGSKLAAGPAAFTPVSVSSATVNLLFGVVPLATVRAPVTDHRSQLEPAVPPASLISHRYDPPAPQVAAPVVTVPGLLPGENLPPSPTLTAGYVPAPL